MMKTEARAVISLVLLIGLAGIGGCGGEEYLSNTNTNMMGVNLSISNAPALNETAQLTFTITSTSVFGAPNTTAQITLPAGFELISGNLSWHGDIPPDGEESFNLTIKSVKIGNWTIEAKAGYPVPDGWYGDEDRLYILVYDETPPASPLEANFLLSNAPALNETAELTLIINARTAIRNMSVEINLPEGLELVSGNLSWHGDIPGGDEVEVTKAVIKAVKIGNWTIESSGCVNPEENWFSLSCSPQPVIYVFVFEDSAAWGIYPPWIGDGYLIPLEQVNESVYGPIGVNLSISNAPALNETAELTCTLTSSIDTPNTTAQIMLPEGLELVSGNLSWHGDIPPDGEESFSVVIKSVKTGNWTIEARVRHPISDGWYVDSGYLYISVSEDTALISKTPWIVPALPPI
jgi:hypothetical protein